MNTGNPEVASPTKRREIIDRLFGRDKKVIQEVPDVPEIPPEVERAQVVLGGSVQQPSPVIDDQTGQVLATPVGSDQIEINLPLTDEQIESGLKIKIANSVRWLAVWCLRLFKKVRFRPKQ